MCIDVTASMQPIIDTVKQNALRLYPDLIAALEAKQRPVDQLRVRVIGFRDVADKEAPPFEISQFFKLPDEDHDFQSFVSSLRHAGGGDLPESGLEALAIAMHSEWTTECERQRHVIALWTDDQAHPLEVGSSYIPAEFQEMVPKNFNELTEMWESDQGGAMPRPRARRLVLFAPDSEIWNRINDEWEQVMLYASQAGTGLDDVDYNTIVDLVAGSIGQ